MTSRNPSQQRVRRLGVTLIELLVVMAVIGILVGILVPVLGPMIFRGSEFVISTELTQLNQSVENFKTEYGFYPPDFSDINNAAEFNAYLVKIAPNHQENVNQWWSDVGVNLNPSNALVFWLGGLRNSAQYPLSYDHDGNPATARLSAPIYSPTAAIQSAVGDRKVFFEFKTERINVTGNVGSYGQAKGNTQLPYIYFNSDYIVDPGTGPVEKFYNEPVTGDTVRPYLKTPGVAGEYKNNDRFQIIAPGLDNRYGTYETTGIPNWQISPHVQTHRDNLTNFSDGGRLDKDIQ